MLPKEDRLRLKIIATEIFENVLDHSRLHFFFPVKFTVWGVEKKILIKWHTCSVFPIKFHTLVATPYYDKKTRRYRGLGLVMCSQLSKEINFRRGLFKRLVLIIL